MEDLAEEVSKGIDLLKDTTKFDEQAFASLVKLTFGVLLGEENEEAIFKSSPSLPPAELKQAYAALTSLVVLFSKINADASQIEEYLTENQVSKERIAVVNEEYRKSFGSLRQLLRSTGFHFSHIVDVQWRCDYLLKTNTMERLNAPVFFVKLKVMDNHKLKDVEFTCNLDQLQDLVSNLKDATASLERLDMYQATEQ